MNKQQLLEKRNADVDALSETEIREYCNIMRQSINLILDAVVAFVNCINNWNIEMIQVGEVADETYETVTARLNEIGKAMTATNVLLNEFWDRKENK